MKKFLSILSALSITFAFTSCLKDQTVEPESTPLEISSKILTFLESNGDYINSNTAPSVISTEEVFQNMDKYLLIDIRTDEEYALGHIETSVRITPSKLIDYISSNEGQYPKIVLISQCGQSSSFYTGLMRMAGFSNVYTMHYGMAYWNKEFASLWISQLSNRSDLFEILFHNKPELTSLPYVETEESTTDMKSYIRDRINNIIAKGFSEDVSENNSTLSTNLDAMMTNNQNFKSYFIICFGFPSFYYSKEDRVPGHLLDAVNYSPQLDYNDLRSDKLLQTLPINRKMILYDYDGIMGAQVVAYLNLLGYDVKMLLFGGNTLFHIYMVQDDFVFNKHVFLTSEIHDYPFVK